MRTRTSSIQQSAVTLLLAIAFGLVAPSGLRAQQPPPLENPDALAENLWQRLELLVTSVVDRDDAGLDEVLCLQDVLPARLAREQALGLVPDAQDPTLVESRTDRLRDDVRLYVTDLLDRGKQVVAIDIGRVHGDPQESLGGSDGPGAPITGGGLLAVELEGLDRDVDLGLVQIGGRWCFDPFAMTPSP